MKIKVALEFKFEIDSSMESDDICYYTDIRDLVDMINEYMDNNSFGVRYTGEWQYITENDSNYKYGVLHYDI